GCGTRTACGRAGDQGLKATKNPGKTGVFLILIGKASGLFIQLFDEFPVDEIVDEGFEVFWTQVAIIDIVGVFPHVDAEDRRCAVNERVFAVRGLGDFELAVLDREPGPARTELADTGSDEIFTELVVAAKIGLDCLFKLARQLLAAAALLHPLPELDVVVVLAGIVEEALILAVAFLDDLFQALAFKAGAFEQLVAVGDIGLMVLVVMKLKRLA